MANILVCDDDKDIVEAIEVYLKDDGHIIYKAYNGADALEILGKEDIQLVILDIMMPVMNGIEVAEKIRESSTLPIIFLSAKSEENDKVTGLNAGADDYITKPFSPAELTARVRSNLRRYTLLGSINEGNTHIYNCGALSINDETKTVTVDSQPVKLTPIEYNILLLLLKNKGSVFSTDKIYESIWNEAPIATDNTVAVHIRHIREKIEIDPGQPQFLKVVWGVGYKIEDL